MVTTLQKVTKSDILMSSTHFYSHKKKRETFVSRFVPRPGVEPGWVAPLVFETSASTDSAIWASSLKDGAKVMLFFYSAMITPVFLQKKAQIKSSTQISGNNNEQQQTDI